MRIAQISPLMESVPPKLYGGTERVVSYLTEELVRQGHEVTLFASGDSLTSARLVAACERALRLDPHVREPTPHHIAMLDKVRQLRGDFDVLHFHIDYLHFPMFRGGAMPTLTTLHGRLDLPDLQPLYRAIPDMPLVSISDDQRRPMPPVRWAGTVHHGLPADLLPFDPAAKRHYLAFLGRISPEKRPDRAIGVAKRIGLPLKIAAKIDSVDRDYFETEIRPLLDDPLIDYIGEIGEHEKPAFLSGALALLFPIDWPEPFGLVMIEAMSCGTPVIAWRRGSVPEVIDDGVTGYVVETMDEAVEAVPRAIALDGAAVRSRFEERFTAERMAKDYMRIFGQLVGGEVLAAPAGLPAMVHRVSHARTG